MSEIPDSPSHRATSIEAFHDETDSGRLNAWRARVERAFASYAPGTTAEVLHKASLDRNLNLTRARATELADEGAIVEIEKRKCLQTGRNAIVWAYVSDPALRVPRAKTDKKSEAIKKLCAALQELITVHGFGSTEAAALQHLINDSLAALKTKGN